MAIEIKEIIVSTTVTEEHSRSQHREIDLSKLKKELFAEMERFVNKKMQRKSNR